MGANGLKVFAMQKLDMGGADDEDIEDEEDDVVESANNGTTLSLSCQWFIWLKTAAPVFVHRFALSWGIGHSSTDVGVFSKFG